MQKILMTVMINIMTSVVFAQEAKIAKFELKVCNPMMKCLRVKSNRALSSQFVQLYFLTDVQVETIQNGKNKTLHGKSGTIDFTNEQLILNSDTGNEYVFNLKTIDEVEYVK